MWTFSLQNDLSKKCAQEGFNEKRTSKVRDLFTTQVIWSRDFKWKPRYVEWNTEVALLWFWLLYYKGWGFYHDYISPVKT